MSLNIKDPEAHRLAQAISSATGESMTRVVIEALQERWVLQHHGTGPRRRTHPGGAGGA